MVQFKTVLLCFVFISIFVYTIIGIYYINSTLNFIINDVSNMKKTLINDNKNIELQLKKILINNNKYYNEIVYCNVTSPPVHDRTRISSTKPEFKLYLHESPDIISDYFYRSGHWAEC